MAAVRRSRAGGLTGGDAPRIGLVGPPRALDALEPLRRAWGERGRVLVLAHELCSQDGLAELACDVDALLVVGPRRRSPRTALPGPLVRVADGRRVPVGSVPDLGWEALRRFATAAARVHSRARDGRHERTVAVLAQRSRRYRDLSRRIERLLGEDGGHARAVRWTADELARPDLVRALGLGVATAVYVGHGRPGGWVAYRGTRSRHLVGLAEPIGAVLSLTCLTASRRRVGLSFAEALVLEGAAAASFGAVSSTDHRWNARWALRLTHELANGCASIGDLVVSAEDDDPAVAGYRILGDPTAPLVDAAGTAARVDALARELAPPR